MSRFHIEGDDSRSTPVQDFGGFGLILSHRSRADNHVSVSRRISLEAVSNACKEIGQHLLDSEDNGSTALVKARKASCRLVRTLLNADFFEAYDKMIAQLGVNSSPGSLHTLRDLIPSNPSLEILTDPEEFEKFLDQEEELLIKLGYDKPLAIYYVDQLRTRFQQLLQFENSVLDEDISASALRKSVSEFSKIVCDDSKDPWSVSEPMKLGIGGLCIISADLIAGLATTNPLFVVSTSIGGAVFGAAIKPVPQHA